VIKEIFKKSIDTPVGDQLKGAPSPAVVGSAAGELTRVKN
jgi:hypothetical protein